MIYFDNSATTRTKPDCVINAVCNTMKFLSANPGRSGHSASLNAGMLVYNTRKKVASLIDNALPENIIFCLNCTEALNFAISGSIKLGGNVITTAYEHNSVLRPLFELEKQGKITVSVLSPNELGHVNASMIARAITPKTYMVITNHYSNVTGAITPIEQIGKLCRSRGILYAVDGAQSVGYGEVSMREQNIDMLAIAPHKGLHAMQGVGALGLSENVTLNPIIYGGTGTASDSVFQPSGYPESLESGTLPTPAIAGLNVSVNWNKKAKINGVSHLTQLSIFALDELKKVPNVQIYTPQNTFNGIISLNIASLSSMDVSQILSDQYDIATRGGLHCAPLIHRRLGTIRQGIVRASLSYENTFDEVEFFIKAIREIAR